MGDNRGRRGGRRAAALIALAVLVGSLALVAQVKDLRPVAVGTYGPVTEQMLRNPPPGEWLNWRRTDNNWGYSALNEINKTNVGQMQLQWSWSMDDTGANEATPLVHDGIMYLPNPRGVIQALDAATGDLIWEYRPGMEAPAPRNPNATTGEQSAIPRQSQRPVAAPPPTQGPILESRDVAKPSVRRAVCQSAERGRGGMAAPGYRGCRSR